MAETGIPVQRNAGWAASLSSLAHSRRASAAIVPLLVLLNLCLTLFLAFKLNVWVDEAFTLHTTAQGIKYAFNQSLRFELQPPLYFVLLGAWRKLDGSIFFARLFSVTCVALSLIVVAGVARKFFKNLHPAWVVAGLALNPFMVWAAVEMRVYALVILLTALLLRFFFDGYLAESPRRRAQLLYLLCAILALYTQYYFGFLLVAHAIVLLILKRWRALFLYLAGMAVVGLCFAPMLFVVRGQVSAHTATVNETVPILDGLKLIYRRVAEYILPPTWETMHVARLWLLRLAALAVAFLFFKKGRSALTESRVALWTTTLSLSAVFFILLFWTGPELLEVRHTATLFLPATLSAYALLDVARQRKLILIWTLIILFFSMSALVVTYKPMAKVGDWGRVAAHIKTQEKTDQPILVFHAGAALPLRVHYAGLNAIVPIPVENRFDAFDVRDYVLRDEAELASLVQKLPNGGQQLWLVTDGVCGYLDVDYNCDTLESFVDKNYAVESDMIFFHSRVRLLRHL